MNEADARLNEIRAAFLDLGIDETDRRNVYTCPRGHGTWTVDVDEGVTPFMISCQTEGCEEPATSHFYESYPDAPAPTHEWYRPRWWATLLLDRNTQDHVGKGGLLLRRR